MITLQATTGINCVYDNYPAECPECSNQIIPIVHNQVTKNAHSYVFLQCPNSNCGIGFVYDFILHYKSSSNHYYSFNRLIKGSVKKVFQSERIEQLSPSFVTIYNQSEHAEQFGLQHICGVGYRKALEHLIKDFLIYQNPDEEENIKKTYLADCISQYVDDERIKATAKIAIWIGDDDDFGTRTWRERELKDLKALIKLTTHWVEMELLSKEFEASMPVL